MNKRNALGRGLAALLPDAPEAGHGRYAEVAVTQIEPNPFQPRQRMEPAKLEELAASLREKGLLQPLLVRRVGSRYQLIAGERRWRAAQAAGFAHVPVVIRDVKDSELLELALVENVQREELNPIEEAHAFKRLTTEFGLSQEQVAERVGKDRSTVTNLVRLLKLPSTVQDLVAAGELTPGHARPLLSLDSPADQVRLARLIVAKGLSVREVEERVKHKPKRTPAEARAPETPGDPNTRAAEDRLREALGTRVRILRDGDRGTVEISFYSEEALSRLFEILIRGARIATARA